MTSPVLSSFRFTNHDRDFAFTPFPEFKKPDLFQVNPQSLPRFKKDEFTPFRFFEPNRFMQDGSADLISDSENDPSNISADAYIQTQSQFENLSDETLLLLRSLGVSDTEIESLLDKSTAYVDGIVENGKYQGYLANVRYVGEGSPNSYEMRKRITRNDIFHLHEDYDHFGLTFKTRYTGNDYLFIQLDRDVPILSGAQPCYLLKLTKVENNDGSYRYVRELVRDVQTRQNVLNNAANNGDLTAALMTANPEKLIGNTQDAQTYCQKALEGGLLYGFSGELSGSMAEARIINIRTPEGFVIQLEHYIYTTPYPGKTRVNGVQEIISDTNDFQNHLNATAFLAHGPTVN